jgi:hypothetical protein
VAPSFANAIFPSPSFFHSFFLSCFKDKLKATVLAWCPDNNSVTHKYFVEMRRLPRDETPFLSVVQLRATTLAWCPYDGNFIPLDTHDHDRLTRDETYPPTNSLSIHLFSWVPLFLQISVSLLSWGIPG